MNEIELKKELMKKDKETIVNLYLLAYKKAAYYDVLKIALSEMLKNE